jgi:cytosine/adenosine deaminase-related metal-dependent hydrolase
MIALFATATLALAGAQAPNASEVLAVHARLVLTGEGPALENGTILIQDGKILAVGKEVRVPQGARELRHDGVASAGMIALHGTPGLAPPAQSTQQTFVFFGPEGHPQGAHPHEGGTHAEDTGHEPEPPAADEPGQDRADPLALDEAAAAAAQSYAAGDASGDTTRTVLPEARVAWGFDPAHSAFDAAARAGVTSLVITPAPKGLVAGQSAVVKTAGGRVLKESAQLAIGLREDAYEQNSFPTSYAGGLAELERRFAEPTGAFEDAKEGRIGVLFETSTRQDVLRAAALAKKHGLKGAVNGAELAGEVAAPLREAGLAVVVGPFGPGISGRALKSIVALAQAGVPFGFGLDAPRESVDALRFSAAACVRAGLDRDVAWSALSARAAEIAGVSDRVGRLARGLDADVVLWSGHPLDLASRVEAVLVDGLLVAGGAR